MNAITIGYHCNYSVRVDSLEVLEEYIMKLFLYLPFV